MTIRRRRTRKRNRRLRKAREWARFLFVGRYSILWYFLTLIAQVIAKLSESKNFLPGSAEKFVAKSLSEDEKKTAEATKALIKSIPRLNRGWIEALKTEHTKFRRGRLNVEPGNDVAHSSDAEFASIKALWDMVRVRLFMIFRVIPRKVIRHLIFSLYTGVAMLLAFGASISATLIQVVFSLTPMADSVEATVNVVLAVAYTIILTGGIAFVISLLRALRELWKWFSVLVDETLKEF